MHLHNKQIYMERLAEHIKPNFYLYTVYESPDNPFIHDRGKEYYAEKPIRIAERQICDTAAEIEKLGYEIYVLDTPAKGISNNSDNNYAKQQYMKDAIAHGKFHRVNIAELLAQQKKADLKRGKNKLQTKITKLLKALQDTFSRQ